jgi:hypothetical protein
MDLQTEYRFDAGVDAVFAMFSDPEYQRLKQVDAGHTKVEIVECGQTASGSFRIVARRTVAVDVPGVLKKVLSPANTVTQTDEWEAEPIDGVLSGVWKVDIKGVPIHISGTMRLEPAASAKTGKPLKTSSVETIDGVVKASLPLVGGKLEKLAHGNFMEATAQEQDFSGRWLAGKL